MIWLASFPRSGNTFFRNVLHDVYGITSSTYHLDPERAADPDYHTHPVVKTHLLPDQLPARYRDQPAVYLVRDGRDALLSIAHHRKDIVAPGTDFHNNLLEATLAQNGSFFGGWSENVRQWTARAAIVIRFEDLIADPIREVEKLRAVMELPQPDHAKLPTFRSIREGKPAYGGGSGRNFNPARLKKHFRSGKTGSWKTEFPPEILDLTYRLHGSTLRAHGYRDVPEQTPLPAKTILIESAKLRTADNDGVKRYLSGLESGLRILLPHYPELKVLFFSGVTGDALSEEKRAGGADFRRLRAREILLAGDDMGYEKALLLAKYLARRALPVTVYESIAGVYRQGPFRRFLTRIRGGAITTRDRLRSGNLKKKIPGADLLHVPLPQHFGNVVGVDDIHYLVTVHDFSHRLFPEYHEALNVDKAEAGMRLALAEGAHFLAVSTATQRDLLDLYDPPPAKVHLVPEAAHLGTERSTAEDIRRRYGLPDQPYLLCLSTLEPRKNLRNTILAFLRLKERHPERDCNLVLAGKKGWKTHEIFAGLDLDRPDIILTGFIDDTDLQTVYAGARALCYVSYYEGFGLPIAEAMACGTPVIFGNNSSQPEVAGEGGTAVDPDDVEGIAAAMHRYLVDEDFRHRKSELARRQAHTFSWLRTALLTIAVYRKILAEQP